MISLSFYANIIGFSLSKGKLDKLGTASISNVLSTTEILYRIFVNGFNLSDYGTLIFSASLFSSNSFCFKVC